MSEVVQWRLEGDVAHLRCGPLSGHVLLSELGVRFLVVSWKDRPADKFGVLVTGGPVDRSRLLKLGEHYVRGADLVANYEKTGPHDVTPQIYWRAAFETAFSAARLEMVLSVRTELLDSQPRCTVKSFGLDAELYHADALKASNFRRIDKERDSIIDAATGAVHLFVFRQSELRLSYAEIVHPSDFVQTEIHSEAQPWLVDSTLFPERLEKGVIRRGRICGWFLPAENDLEFAVELARRFIDEPLPLTA